MRFGMVFHALGRMRCDLFFGLRSAKPLVCYCYTNIGLAATVICMVCFVTPAYADTGATGEKYALLIGIDKYAQPSRLSDRFSNLRGPRNDVQLIRNLLVSYDFKDDDNHIKVLLGSDATHEAIKEAFKTQLIENAKSHPGAIVVFYFSGHGSEADRVAPGDTSWHDTLVAFDSRAGGNKDILDNELIDWFEQLRKYTPNATFILDSCHSGSAIKDIGPMVSRKLPPNPSQSEVYTEGSRDISNLRYDARLLDRRQQFTLLSGSLARESSYEDLLPTPAGPKYHGYFTYYLDQALRLNPESTADQVVRVIKTDFDTARPRPPSQTPQAVGDVQRVVFGFPGDREDTFIKIVAVKDGNNIEIDAGALQGLKEGAFLAVYSPSAKHLTGESDKIANAQVIQVFGTSATARLSDQPRQPLTQQAKVTIVTPYFGSTPLKFSYDALVNERTTDGDRSVLKGLKEALEPNKLIAEAIAGVSFDLGVRRGCNDNDVFVPATTVESSRQTKCDHPVYYLTGQFGDAPLFGYKVSASNPNAVGELAERVSLRAKQAAVRGLSNATSSMKGLVRISLIRVDLGKDASGRTNIKQGDSTDGRTSASWKVGDHFQIKIENNSDRDVYVGTLMLGSSGRIELITANPHGDLLHPNSSLIFHAPRDIGLPLGVETYKLIATTAENVNFIVFDQPPGAKGTSASPLEWFFSQTTNTTTRDSIPTQDVNIDDWVTDSVDINILPSA